MPHVTLDVRGPGLVADVDIGVSKMRAALLRGLGEPVPKPVRILALIDTGATVSAIDERIVKQLSLRPTGSTLINTFTTGAVPARCDEYDVSIELIHLAATGLIFDPVAVSSAPLQQFGVGAIIGLNILSKCLLLYDGPNGRFTLAL